VTIASNLPSPLRLALDEEGRAGRAVAFHASRWRASRRALDAASEDDSVTHDVLDDEERAA
jgi:hypothetical protein